MLYNQYISGKGQAITVKDLYKYVIPHIQPQTGSWTGLG